MATFFSQDRPRALTSGGARGLHPVFALHDPRNPGREDIPAIYQAAP
jgi:hypothetical protein